MDFEELKHTVFRDILKRLPKHLTYHSITHTEYVMEKAEFFGRIEKLPAEELLLLKIAALFHDTGFIENPKNHEEIGCRIAQDYLKEELSDRDLKMIFGMIMATKIPQSPRNLLERILADADLEYLGTDQFQNQGEALFEELKYFNPELTETQWNELQLSFLEKHQYHTDFCKKYREPVKQENLQKVKDALAQT
ncbi:HD domain-containing protein [Algoriphagus sp.]|uniref:HD domain-containing protein n=1 Tax=Algoriphagus sp. TaxID=1872435 RepID=UPI00262AAB7A|nr:HD domain-containing protein [Algoriphagus sp.]